MNPEERAAQTLSGGSKFPLFQQGPQSARAGQTLSRVGNFQGLGGSLMRWATVCWCALVATHAFAAEAPKPEQVEAWIKDLSSEEYAVREDAEKGLKNAGETIIPRMKDLAEKTADAE